MAIAEFVGISSIAVLSVCILNYICIYNLDNFEKQTTLTSYADDASDVYVVDDTWGVGRRFDGIGAISGGGVSFPHFNNYI